MDNTILIWKYLLPFLKNNEDLNAYIHGKIFPLISNDAQTLYPFIVYRRDNISVEYTKTPFQGWDNTVTISVGVYSEDYTTGVEILNIVRNIFENKTLTTEDIKIHNMRVTDISEQRGDDCYLQSISFTFLAE